MLHTLCWTRCGCPGYRSSLTNRLSLRFGLPESDRQYVNVMGFEQGEVARPSVVVNQVFVAYTEPPDHCILLADMLMRLHTGPCSIANLEIFVPTCDVLAHPDSINSLFQTMAIMIVW